MSLPFRVVPGLGRGLADSAALSGPAWPARLARAGLADLAVGVSWRGQRSPEEIHAPAGQRQQVAGVHREFDGQQSTVPRPRYRTGPLPCTAENDQTTKSLTPFFSYVATGTSVRVAAVPVLVLGVRL